MKELIDKDEIITLLEELHKEYLQDLTYSLNMRLDSKGGACKRLEKVILKIKEL